MHWMFAPLLVGIATISFAGDPAVPNYYPLAKGTKWEYRLSSDEQEINIACEITEGEAKGGKHVGRIEAKFPNAVTLGEELAADANGVYRTAMFGAKLSQPLTILKYPVKARDEWKEKIKIGEHEATITVVVKDIQAIVQVPAGTYTTISIESVVEMNGEKSVAAIWYANGVGIVKQHLLSGTKLVTMELIKFSAPK